MEKTCEWCGKEFIGRKNARYCADVHYKSCENSSCNNSFVIKEMKRPSKSCSKACSDELTKQGSMKKLQCNHCGNYFISTNLRALFCKAQHYNKCAVCETEFEIYSLHKPSTTCSKECAWKTVEDVESVVRKRTVTSNLNYGVDNPSQSDEIKGKKIDSSLKKYGVDNVSKASEVKEKRQQTYVERFGANHPMHTVEVRNKLKATNVERYGVENVFMLRSFQDKSRAAMKEKYGVENIFMLPENQLKAAERSGKRISKVNKEWQLLLEKETCVKFEFEQQIARNMYADLGYNETLIDLNPTVTHNSTVSFVHTTGRCDVVNCEKFSHLPREHNYHHQRALEAEKNGKILLQYFDWYDPEIFLNIVKSKLMITERKLYARKTVLKEIPQSEANKFFRENHLMGASNKQTLCLGLFHGEELVHCQTYGPARMSKKAEWEAIRSASKLNTHIVGGFSKCDKYFFKTINPRSVISYVDLSISHGETETMFDGWALHAVNKASATWTRMKPGTGPMFIRESTVRRVSADRILGFEVGEKYPRLHADGSKVTNDFVLLSEGYVKVYDAGTKTFMWNKQSNPQSPLNGDCRASA